MAYASISSSCTAEAAPNSFALAIPANCFPLSHNCHSRERGNLAGLEACGSRLPATAGILCFAGSPLSRDDGGAVSAFAWG